MAAAAAVRVLHLCAGNLYGGVERIVVECARSRALCPEMTPAFGVCFEGRLSSEIDEAGASCTPLGAVRASRPDTVWRARRRIAALLEKDQPDAVICHSSWIYAVAAPVIREADAVLWLHDRVSGRTWIERWAGRIRPALVVCNSRFTEQSVDRMFPGAARRVVYAPVDPGTALVGAERAAVRADLGASPDTTVILIASRLDPMKGHRELLDALGRAGGDWQVWIAGGPQRRAEDEYLRVLIGDVASSSTARRVRFLGSRSDVPTLMRAADILCQPNTSPESFGLTFIEALYAGIPVVTTEHGGAREIVTPACGFLTPPNDRRSLEDALSRLIANRVERVRLGAAGPVRARELCDPRRQLGLLAASVGARMAGTPAAAGIHG